MQLTFNWQKGKGGNNRNQSVSFRHTHDEPKKLSQFYPLQTQMTYSGNRKLMIFTQERYDTRNWDSVVGIATGYWLEHRGVGVRVSYVPQTGSGAHPVSHPMDIRGTFHGGKAPKTWSWQLTSK
jgi:hypothetical protein